MEFLEQSLKRLGTDYLDLWQVHAVASLAQVERAFAPGGVIEALDEARRQGKVRYVGFTGHTEPDVHLGHAASAMLSTPVSFPVSAIEAKLQRLRAARACRR